MEIIVDVSRESHTSNISCLCVATTVNEERLITNVTTITASLVNTYTRGEVDSKIAQEIAEAEFWGSAQW